MHVKTAPPTALLELQRWPHWVVWRTEERDGKPTKVPYDPHTGRRASSTDEETWAPYEVAVKALERRGADGLGYVFAPNDEYAGVDLDKCITDGQVHPEAWKIVERLSSYTELSPTGTGLHIIVRGRINGDRKRTAKTDWGGDFESYDQGRFFTVTGDRSHFLVASTPAKIESRQEELDAIRAELFPPEVKSNGNLLSPAAVPSTSLDDVELLERARKARNGAKFIALYDRGDPSGHAEDESAADLALCNMLAFYAGPNPARIDSLFRRSGLMRDKWDSPRPEHGTYGAQTIAKALEGKTEFYDPQRKRASSAAKTFEGRKEAEAEARAELADIFGLGDLSITRIVAAGRDTKARHDIHISDGSVLTLDPLAAYTTAPKLGAEIATQLGAFPKLKDDKDRSRMLEVLTLIHTVREIREELTLDQRARDFGISFLQEAPTRDVDWNNQTDKWEAFEALKFDPVLLASSEKTSVATQALVLVDKDGRRYVRASWFNLYVKSVSAPGVADEVCRRMLSQGWTKAGSEGRIKATNPAGGKPLQWAFFIVEKDWEET
jgi:primase-polymerase (primpol)-like protein